MKKKEIRIILVFFAILLICLAGGYATGRLVRWAQAGGGLDTLLDGVREGIAAAAPWGYALISGLAFLAAVCIFGLAYREAVRWDGENEEVIERVEKRLNILNMTAMVMQVINFFLFPLCLYFERFELLAEVCFLLNAAWIFGIVALGVWLDKKLNPEKQGSPFDLHFARKWEDSCDEAQKWTMYEAGYRAYQTTQICCMLLWVISCVGMLSFHTGILAVLVVCLIWFAAAFTYNSKTRK